jgi:hypothetical protein
MPALTRKRVNYYYREVQMAKLPRGSFLAPVTALLIAISFSSSALVERV